MNRTSSPSFRQWSGKNLAKIARGTLFSLSIAALAACASPPPPTSQNPNATNTSATNATQSRLDIVLDRGELICGVSGEVPGFSFIGSDGEYSGIDVDMCRAVAAALFDDPTKVQYKNLNAKERFAALQTGEIDMLSRNTTWTTSRDTSVGLEFAPVTFYDGQGMMVRKNSGITTLADMAGKDICIQIGTTSELNLADQMRKRGIEFTPISFEGANEAFNAYDNERCVGITADRSALNGRRVQLSEPDAHVLLEDVLSKEPLAPAVANGDAKWSDAVRWIIFSTIEAEDLGVNSSNIAEMSSSDNAEVKRFLGVEGDLGQNMGLSNDFAARVITHVGNYGEIYDRNLGPDSDFALPRGQNRLWTDGGLMYSPPFR
jgi:general L-amino acid transport system substrate-binding protein